jgi:hypothetical protein
MGKVIDKELISQLLKLEIDQQEKVLAYINDLLEGHEMNRIAEAGEKEIIEGRSKSFDLFNENFEQWKISKRTSMK